MSTNELDHTSEWSADDGMAWHSMAILEDKLTTNSIGGLYEEVAVDVMQVHVDSRHYVKLKRAAPGLIEA